MKKIAISLALLMVLLAGAGMSASAANVCYCIQAGLPAGIMMARCNGEKINYGQETHKYGLFWANTCTYTIYKSTGKEFCSKCGYVYSVGGPHDCVAQHHNCDKGRENVCMVGAMDPWEKASESEDEVQ